MSHCECGEQEEERDEGMRQRGRRGGEEAEKPMLDKDLRNRFFFLTEDLSPYLSNSLK